MSPRRYAEDLSPHICECDLIRNKVFADYLCNQVKGGPYSNTTIVPIRRGKFQCRHTHPTHMDKAM